MNLKHDTWNDDPFQLFSIPDTNKTMIFRHGLDLGLSLTYEKLKSDGFSKLESEHTETVRNIAVTTYINN